MWEKEEKGQHALKEIVLERKKKEAQETSEKNLRIQNQGIFFREVLRGRRRGKRNNCSQDYPGTLATTYLCFILFCSYDPLMILGIYFADWCGRKGPQIAVLKLDLCLFDMFIILLMSLIPPENKLHTCPSSDWMVEITSCFYSNLILNHSPVLS